jgi:hypothetical protein
MASFLNGLLVALGFKKSSSATRVSKDRRTGARRWSENPRLNKEPRRKKERRKKPRRK